MKKENLVTDEQILELKRNETNNDEIANILGISKASVSRCIRKNTVKKIIELKRNGKNNDEIANILGIKKRNVTMALKDFEYDKTIDNASTNRTINKEAVNLGNKGTKNVAVYREEEQTKHTELENLQEELTIKLQEHKITKKDIKVYQELLMQETTIAPQQINFMVKLCVITGQTYQAIQCIDMLISKTPITEMSEIEKLEAIKEHIKKAQIQQQIRKLIQDGVKTNKIAEEFGLPETTVIQIRNKMEKTQGIQM